MKNYTYLLILLFCLNPSKFFANIPLPALCTGSNSILSVSDRPSVAFSPCTVGNKTVYVESGYAYQHRTPNGYGYNLPQTEIRFGIIDNTEVDIFPPNYLTQNYPDQSGTTANSVGLKHIVFSDAQNIWTLQGYITPASGSRYYGTIQTSYLLSSIFSHTFDSGLSITSTLGLASNAASSAASGNTFYTFNPILDIGWNFTERLAAYVELYSQSKYDINKGFGLSTDGGLLYMVTPHLSVDVSYGHRIAGYLNDINYYYGTGVTFSFGL